MRCHCHGFAKKVHALPKASGSWRRSGSPLSTKALVVFSNVMEITWNISLLGQETFQRFWHDMLFFYHLTVAEWMSRICFEADLGPKPLASPMARQRTLPTLQPERLWDVMKLDWEIVWNCSSMVTTLSDQDDRLCFSDLLSWCGIVPFYPRIINVVWSVLTWSQVPGCGSHHPRFGGSSCGRYRRRCSFFSRPEGILSRDFDIP